MRLFDCEDEAQDGLMQDDGLSTTSQGGSSWASDFIVD